ncbi:MAG: hypothetical protein U0326_21730 [Polyangiales bacterium]
MSVTSAPSPIVWLLLVALVLGCDALARWADVYAATLEGWRARWRLRSVQRSDAEAPYRSAVHGDWEEVSPAGIPRLVSCALLPVVGLTLAWTIAVFLSFGDLLGVIAGHRTLARTLAVIVFCVIRGGLGWAVLGAGYARNVQPMVLCSMAALTLDGALSQFEIPCSDVRAEDVRMGYWGAAIDALALLAFALKTLRPRGTTEVDPTSLPRMN